MIAFLRQYDQDFFKDMHKETGVDLENIVYYKDQVYIIPFYIFNIY